MATQTVEFSAASGLTVTAKLFSAGSDTEVASVSATEKTNDKGTYTAAYTDLAAGTYRLTALSDSTPVAKWWVTVTAATATFQAYEVDKTNYELVDDAIGEDQVASSAVTKIQDGLATAANQTTILARLGAWTGTGVNTILGAFKAVLSKAATTPSDIGGTSTPAADSLEAIRDRGDFAWKTGASSGTSGGNTRQSFFRVYSTVRSIVRGDTYSLGVRPLIFEDDGSWNLTTSHITGLTKIRFTANHKTEAGESIAVSKTTSVSEWVASDGSGEDAISIVIPLTSDDTEVEPGDYNYDLELTLTSGDIVTPEIGTLTVTADQSRPT